ncbi:hypothetical protein P3T33_000315 [Rhizobium sp. AN67]|nr:hypothetical protein [Rhizobium sp. AN67]
MDHLLDPGELRLSRNLRAKRQPGMADRRLKEAFVEIPIDNGIEPLTRTDRLIDWPPSFPRLKPLRSMGMVTIRIGKTRWAYSR